MRKIAISILVLLLFTGCTGKGDSQTLFVADSKDRYGLVNIDGKKQTDFIYDRYESIDKYGYIVVKGNKYGYLSYDGQEVIALGKYKQIESIYNMLVAYDKSDNISILNSEGEILYSASKKIEIILSGLPIVHDGKEYIVLYDNGKELVKSKDVILSASKIKDGYLAVCFKDSINIYNEAYIDSFTEVKTGGQYQLMSKSKDRGYVLYNRQKHQVLSCGNDGKVLFNSEIDLDDIYFDSDDNMTGVKNQITYLFDKKGTAVAINSYYQSLDNYVLKNKELIYGPHKFIGNGQEVDVNSIQLDPMASHISNNIFPVYVRDKGYVYYGFDGKQAIKTVFNSAEVYDRNRLAVVSKEDDKYYLINGVGKKVSKKYRKIVHLGQKYYAGFISGSRYELIDTNGKKVIDDNFMDDGIVFTYKDMVYGIFNKSGTSYVYDMNELEVVFLVEGSLEFADDGYFVLDGGNGYYSLEGKEIYKR